MNHRQRRAEPTAPATAASPASVADHHTGLGNAARRRGATREAIDHFARALQAQPNRPEWNYNLATALAEAGRLNEAAAGFRAALRLRPAFWEAWNNLGLVLTDRGEPAEAAECFRAALRLQPRIPETHTHLGIALRRLGRLDEAASALREAIRLRPRHADAHNVLGAVRQEDGAVGEALACYQAALAVRPDHADARNNLGTALGELGRRDEAIAAYLAAIALEPDFADARHNLAMALLARGDWDRGWAEYEWRWRTPQFRGARRGFAQPHWGGAAAPGRTLLIHAEQGFGDTLQFCRLAALAAARGPRVVLEVQRPLARLLRGLPGVAQVVARGEALPAFDLHCPLLSLPRALGLTVATVPAETPYLRADPALARAWRARLDAVTARPRVGLTWAGNPRSHAPDLAAAARRRCVPPERLVPLLDTPGAAFVSLQKDGPALPPGVPVLDFMAEMEDFADTAALIANLDLVISVDTAVAHLAGALGKPVWLLDRFDPCWRWFTDRRDSPWYPTLRIYRQPHPADWESVVAEVAADLRRARDQGTGP